MVRITASRHKSLALALVVTAAASLSGCHKHDQATAVQTAEATKAATAVGTSHNVLDALGGAANLGAFTKLAKSAGLEKTFGGVGDYTLFAPTDAALAKLSDTQRKLLESPDGRPQLLAMLRQHIATGYITQADLEKALARDGGAVSLASMGGSPVRLHRQGSAIFLGHGEAGPKIAASPIVARNGVIYPIDQVIAPAKR